MSVNDVLLKLANKEALKGNSNYSSNLVAVAKKDKCSYCENEAAELMEKKGKKMCSKCAKPTKCSAKGCEVSKPFGEMIKKAGKSYCCGKCAGEKTALSELINKYAQDLSAGTMPAGTDGYPMGSEDNTVHGKNPYSSNPQMAAAWQEGFTAGSQSQAQDPTGSNGSSTLW